MSQDCYARWDPNHDPDFQSIAPDAMSTRNEELEAHQAFQDVHVQDFVHARKYTTAEYGALLRTFSNVHALGEASARGLVTCVERLIETQFAGSIVRKDLYRVWFANSKA